MNEEQKILYDEWVGLENSNKFGDIEKLKVAREQVWDKLKNILSPNEKFDLGTKLNKTIKDIFQAEWPPKGWSDKKTLAWGAIFRAKSGLVFLEECLDQIHFSETDPVFSRSLYILLSHNVELILESRLLLASCQTEKDKLVEEIKMKKPHNLRALADKLYRSNLLESIDIKYVKENKNGEFTEYVVETLEGKKIIVQDLIDVRYDFKIYQLRDSDFNESKRLREEIKILLNITKKIIGMIELIK